MDQVKKIIIGVIMSSLVGQVWAQTATVSPDFSIGANMKGKWLSQENHEKGGMNLEEIELAYQGYLYPQLKADVFLSIEKEGTDYKLGVEEAYLTASTPLAGLGAKIGKKKVNFGKVQALHPEQLSYTERPLVIQNFFGEEAAAPEGISIDYVFPLPWFVQLEVASGRLDLSADPDSTEFSLHGDLASAKLRTSVEVGQTSDWEWGISWASAFGPMSGVGQDAVNLVGTDLTGKWTLDNGAKLTWQTEFINLKREYAGESISRSGGYSYFGYRWDRFWETGLRADVSQSADLETQTTRSLTAVATHYLSDTTRGRLEYTLDTNTSQSQITLQLQFILGPHKHALQ